MMNYRTQFTLPRKTSQESTENLYYVQPPNGSSQGKQGSTTFSTPKTSFIFKNLKRGRNLKQKLNYESQPLTNQKSTYQHLYSTCNSQESRNDKLQDLVYSENYVLKKKINEIKSGNYRLKGKLGYTTNLLKQYEQQFINQGYMQSDECIFNVSMKYSLMQKNPEHLLLKQKVKELQEKVINSKQKQLEILNNNIFEQKNSQAPELEIKKTLCEQAHQEFINNLLKAKTLETKINNGAVQALSSLQSYKQDLSQTVFTLRSNIEVELFSQTVSKEQLIKIIAKIQEKNKMIEQIKVSKQKLKQKYSEITYNETQQVQKFAEIFFMNKQRNKNNMYNIDTIIEMEKEQLKNIIKQKKQIDQLKFAIQQQGMLQILEKQDQLKLIKVQKDQVAQLRAQIYEHNAKIFLGGKVYHEPEISVISNDNTTRQQLTSVKVE